MAVKKDKAILLVSFGTTYEKTRSLTIDSIEEFIRNKFEDYEIYTAFTSHMVIKVLKERDKILVDTPEEALDKLVKQGYKEVIVQSLHIMPGEEYEYVANVVDVFSNKKVFERIVLGRPVLYFKGDGQDLPDDYFLVIEAIKLQLPNKGSVVFMGHGSSHPANSSYACLQMVLKDHNINNVYIGTVEGYPSLNNVISKLKKDCVEEVTLMPFMVVAGDHCMNDMASDDEDSWKSNLAREGFKVNLYLHGLGENKVIKEIFAEHLEDAITNKYINLGKTQKGR